VHAKKSLLAGMTIPADVLVESTVVMPAKAGIQP